MIDGKKEQETAAVAHLVRAFALHAESFVFKSRVQQTQVDETSSDSSTAQRLVRVHFPRGLIIYIA